MAVKNILQKTKNIDKTIYCRAFRHRFDGNVFQEMRNGKLRWIAYLECLDCGSTRTDTLTPVLCDLISRKYKHDDDYDTTMSPKEAKKIIYSRMLKELDEETQ